MQRDGKHRTSLGYLQVDDDSYEKKPNQRSKEEPFVALFADFLQFPPSVDLIAPSCISESRETRTPRIRARIHDEMSQRRDIPGAQYLNGH